MEISKKTVLPLLFFSALGMSHAQESKPNIILIMSDDMGYSDLGCYGSEIHTPNLDRLASNGIRFTQFYNQARCCPTRASLMTGLYPHQAGVGWMTSRDDHLPGYRGELNEHCVTIAQVLKSAGYSTYMDGKWHLMHNKDTRQDSPNYDWPLQRGFDKFYGILIGAASFYDPATLCRDNTLITPYNDPAYKPEHYYFTDAITDNAVKFIQEDKGDKPFFMYVAYTAAHWPMQAPESEIAKYKGKYDKGWEYIRRERIEKMKKLGVVSKDIDLSPLDTHTWEEEANKPFMTRRMETYAAMIDIMDQGIGKIVAELKEKGLFNNTVILFLEDNGGNAEGMGFGGPDGEVRPVSNRISEIEPMKKDELQTHMVPPATRDGKAVMFGLQVMAGPADTYLGYLRPWAQVSNTPFKKYKHYVHEGGISTPLIVHWPNGIKAKGELRNQIGNVIDIMPTLAELGGAKYPNTFNGAAITPVAGVSLVPAFYDKPIERKAIFWEHEMNRAVRMGKWKLVSTGRLFNEGSLRYYQNAPWELYNINEDRSELRNLSGEYPDLVKEMSAMWTGWAKQSSVYPTPWQEKKFPLRGDYVGDGHKWLGD